ncbi:MAG TPA: hypothetical protein VFQ75_14105, partial [Candidatus Limnocylindrales bacterium]|nr:hypothetical protein [Candidatus Limnocylindrales bacterium]
MKHRRWLVAGILVVAAGLVAAGLLATGVVRTGPAAPSVALGAPRFVDETSSAGLVHTYDGNEDYDIGGGLAVLDCDGDGRPDVYAAGGE